MVFYDDNGDKGEHDDAADDDDYYYYLDYDE